MKMASKYTRPKGEDYVPPRTLKKLRKIRKRIEFRVSEEFVNIEDTFSYRMYDAYKRKSKNPMVLTEYRKLINKFFIAVRKHLLNNEAGVFIKDFGYFCIIRNPKPQRKNFKFSMKHKFEPTFIPIRKDNLMQTWTLDHTFLHFIHFVLRMKMLKGKKYKMAYTMLNNLYGTSQVSVYKKELYDNNK